MKLMLVKNRPFFLQADLNRQFGDITNETKHLVLAIVGEILVKSDQMALCLQETSLIYKLWTACASCDSEGTHLLR